mmetsp:Transcript_9889/g.9578  ORF Transcript_9889/g.9578 Transcript_9889/m.9578 type:complete len:136 (-) Transcript_9889:26-433(-)
METLRLHPTAPESFRFAKKDDKLPDGTRIPRGSLVMFSINTINHSEKVWTDPDTFNPDRFLHRKYPSQYQFATFSAGPRLCPGQSLSMMEITTCVAFLVNRYDILDVEGHSGDMRWTMVMSMKDGFRVKIKRRTT